MNNSKGSGRRSAAYRARDRRFLWHPFTQQQLWMEEEFPVIDKGRGSWLIDVDGRRYLDGVSSLWCNLVGHGNREIDRAMTRQMRRVSHSTMLGASHPAAVELAERLVAIAPKGLARVFYSDNGSTAMEVALKMAFQYWQQNGRPKRTTFVSFAEGYHGDTIGAVSAGAIPIFHDRFRPLLFPTIKLPTCYPYRGQTEEAALRALESTLSTGAETIAGVCIEPLVQGAGGMLTHSPAFVARVRELCTKHDVFLIADEVMTGFGRTGTMFACGQAGVTPDFLALSKGLTGGMVPLGATLTTARVYDGFLGDTASVRTFFHGHTYTGNPLACAAALGMLRFLKDERTIEHLAPKIARFQSALGALRDRADVGDVRMCGLIAGIELVKEKATREPFPYEQREGWRRVVMARARGVLLRPLGNTLVVMPPLTITMKELDLLTKVVGEVVAARPGTTGAKPGEALDPRFGADA
jgi:adenosylmethionine-8-amino-7-oxononanoate aminotransferase